MADKCRRLEGRANLIGDFSMGRARIDDDSCMADTCLAKRQWCWRFNPVMSRQAAAAAEGNRSRCS